MSRVLTILLAIIIASCNAANNDNSDGKNDNFEFSLDQLGKVEFNLTTVDFGSVVLENESQRIIQVTNVGKLAVTDFESTFDGEEFSSTFKYAGELGKFPGEGGTCPAVIPSGATCSMVLSFLPTAQETKTSLLNIVYNNGLSNSAINLNLTGYGGAEADLAYTDNIIDFSYVDQGASVAYDLIVTNEGGQVARDLSFSLTQNQDIMGRDLFSIDTSATTCPIAGGNLGIGEDCVLSLLATSNIDQEYADFFGNITVNYKYDPESEDITQDQIDLQFQVVSIEGVLNVSTATVDFGDFVNGDIEERSVIVQNTGYDNATVTAAQIAGSEGAVSINITDCVNLSNEQTNGLGQVIIPPSTTCIFRMTFAPVVGVLPGDFSASDIYFDYDNTKTGLVSTDSFAVDANLVAPADLIIQLAADPHLETWPFTGVFIANDTRFLQEQTYTIENIGAVVAQQVSINFTGSPYVSQVNDCGTSIDVGETCDVTLTMDPLKSVFDMTGSFTLASTFDIQYQDQTAVSFGVPTQAITRIQTTGAVAVRPELVFDDFDSSLNGSTSAVAGSSAFADIAVKNVGALDESNFDLNIVDAARFSIVDDAGLITINGEPNCAHIDSGAGTLASGDLCYYRIRVFEAVNGTYASDMDISFNSGGGLSAAYNLSATFSDPGKIELLTPVPEDQVAVRSYVNFNYPGEGTSTSVTSPSLVQTTGNGSTSVPLSQMSFPTPPVAMNIDFALIELGYQPQATSQEYSVGFSNTGDFNIEVRDVSLIQMRNETLDSVVTGTQFSLPLDLATECYGNSITSTVSPSNECRMRINFNPPDSDAYSALVRVQYTLGQKTTPTSEDLYVYTSYFTFLGQGYDLATVARLEPVNPPGLTVDGELSLSVVHGVGDTDTEVVVLQNTGVGTATDIHYTALEGTDPWDVSGTSVISMADLVQMPVPSDNYYQLPIAQCAAVTANEMAVGENCALNTVFNPSSTGTSIISVIFRYNNGVEYISESYDVRAVASDPADLIVREIDGFDPLYSYDYGEQIVEGSYSQYIEIRNQGETQASSIAFNPNALPYRMVNSTNPTYPGCGTTLAPDTSCFVELFYEPLYADVDLTRTGDFNFSYDNGWNPALAGGTEIRNFTIRGIGFAEEKHTQHQGWTHVESYGENQTYADWLNTNGFTKPGGLPYTKYDLGYVRLVWNEMADEGVIADAIDQYLVFKSTENDFDLHSDSPYAIVPVGLPGEEVEFIDDAVANTPGSVFFYYIVAERNGKRSRVNLQNYPIGSIRIAIPYAYSSLLHKYQASMETCRMMQIDVNNAANIDLSNNGCRYLDRNGAAQVLSYNSDLHIDKYEASVSYAQGSSAQNIPGNNIDRKNFDDALAVCNSKSVLFTTTAPGMTGTQTKTMMSKQEHFIVSQPVSGSPYDIDDCETNNADRVTGDGEGLCESKYLLEYIVGGFPEWTTTRISGLGLGAISNYNGFNDQTWNGVNLKGNFPLNLQLGFNKRNFVTIDESLTELCIDTILGVPVPRHLGSCPGERLKEITFDGGLATNEIFDMSGVAENTFFEMMYFNQDVTGIGVTINALVGGGDLLTTSTKRDYDPYTTQFYTNDYPNGTYRCVLRLSY